MLTIADLSRGPGRSEKVEVVSREYTIAAAMVQTMDAQYGADAYWKLFAGFRQDPVTSRVFANAGLSEAGVFDATAAKTSKCS